MKVPLVPINTLVAGADPGFLVGGGGVHFKKLRRAEEGANIFGVFRVKKITILRQKIIFFPFLRDPPLSRVMYA